MKQLKNCVAPIKVLGVILIPFVMVLIIMSVFAAGLSILDFCTFREATHAGPMIFLCVLLYIGILISTVDMIEN